MVTRLKTGVLLAGMSGLLLFLGGTFAGEIGLTIALGIALVMNGVSYFKSDKIAVKMAKAEPMERSQYPEVYRIVEELSARAEEPMPAMYLSPSPQLNAFATGRDPEHAVVCVNQGLYEALTEEELEGVLGHELQHVYNRDILIGSVAAVIATAITYLSLIGRFAFFFGGGGGDDDRNPFTAIIALLVAPIAAMLIQAAITRSRESHADHTGAELTGKPMALASALQKLEAGAKDPRRLRMGGTPAETNSAMGHLFIAAPFGGRLNPMKLFSTHPPVPERVAALEAQAREMGQIA